MADAPKIPSYLVGNDYSLSEYEAILDKDRLAARESETDDYVDNLKNLIKTHVRSNRKVLVENKIIDPKTHLSGYGQIGDEHVHKGSGKKWKNVLAEDLMHKIAAYTMQQVGMSEGSIKETLGGLNAMKKIKDKDGKDIVVPNKSARAAYLAQISSMMDNYFGQKGSYQRVVRALSNEKSYVRAMKGELGKVFERFSDRLHPDADVEEKYIEKLNTDIGEAENFKKNAGKQFDAKGLEVISSDLEGIIGHHRGFKSDSNYTVAADDPVLRKKKPKK